MTPTDAMNDAVSDSASPWERDVAAILRETEQLVAQAHSVIEETRQRAERSRRIIEAWALLAASGETAGTRAPQEQPLAHS